MRLMIDSVFRRGHYKDQRFPLKDVRLMEQGSLFPQQEVCGRTDGYCRCVNCRPLQAQFDHIMLQVNVSSDGIFVAMHIQSWAHRLNDQKKGRNCCVVFGFCCSKMGLSSPEGSQGDTTVSSLSIQILTLYLEMLNLNEVQRCCLNAYHKPLT